MRATTSSPGRAEKRSRYPVIGKTAWLTFASPARGIVSRALRQPGEGFREFLGGLVGEQGGVDVGDLGELFGDRGVDPWMAVAEAGDCGTAGAVDDFAAVGGVQIDPFPSRREHGIGEQGAVEDTAHGGRDGPLIVRLQPGDSSRD